MCNTCNLWIIFAFYIIFAIYHIAKLSLNECISVMILLLLPLVQLIDLKPLAKVSGVGLFNINYYIICIEKHI